MKPRYAAALLIGTGLLFGALPVADILASTAQAANTTVRIAIQAPLSGTMALLGEGIVLGAQLAADKLGEPLTRMGYKAELITFDDRSDTQVSIKNAKSIVSDPTIVAVVGHLRSVDALAVSAVYRDAKLALISPASSDAALTDRGYRNVFRVIGRDDVQGAAASQFAYTSLKARSVYLVYDDTPYGANVAESFKLHAEKVGMKVVGFQQTNRSASFTEVIAPIKMGKPDVLYFAGAYDEAAPFFKAARDNGVKARFLGPDALNSPNLVRLGGRSALGTYYTVATGPLPRDPLLKTFADDYKKLFARNPEPFSTYAYDAVSVALKAIEEVVSRGNRPTREGVATANQTTRYSGLTGFIEFDERGDRKQATYWIFQVASASAVKWSENPSPKRITLDTTAAKRYVTVSVFYGTDRKRTGSPQPSDYYGPTRGELDLGVCEVSIPLQHTLGNLETPFIQVLENPLKHVVLLSLQRFDREHWLSDVSSKVEASQQKDALVFVHGYNVTFEDACRRTAQLAYDLKFSGAPLMWSWPASGKTLDYVKDLNDAEWTANNFKEFLLSVARTGKVRTIHLVAHSMGARVVTRALADLSPSGPSVRRPLFHHIVLAAPDIDRDIFLRLAPAVRASSEGITLYASSNDRALQISNNLQGGARAGEAGANLLLVNSVDTIDASSVDTSLIGHSYYGDKVSVITDLYELLQLRRPPAQRFHLKEQSHTGRTYWEFRR